jgi:hypothetical protein
VGLVALTNVKILISAHAAPFGSRRKFVVRVSISPLCHSFVLWPHSHTVVLNVPDLRCTFAALFTLFHASAPTRPGRISTTPDRKMKEESRFMESLTGLNKLHAE